MVQWYSAGIIFLYYCKCRAAYRFINSKSQSQSLCKTVLPTPRSPLRQIISPGFTCLPIASPSRYVISGERVSIIILSTLSYMASLSYMFFCHLYNVIVIIFNTFHRPYKSSVRTHIRCYFTAVSYYFQTSSHLTEAFCPFWDTFTPSSSTT